MKRITRAAAAAACLLAVGAGMAAATASAPAGAAAGTIFGCVRNSGTRAITSVKATAHSCPAGSSIITWQGTIGPAPTPSPTPTTTACVTSAASGSCGLYTYPGITASNGSNTYVASDMWNAIAGAAQTLTARSPGDWSVTATMPAGNTAVVSYPDSSQLYTTTADTPAPLSGFSQITSTFADSGTGNPGDYEWAYDIWEGAGSANYAQEIMIWTANHDQRPAGSDTGPVTIAGAGYELWTNAGHDPVTLVAATAGAAGSVDVLAALNWLVANGDSPAGTGLNMIEYGAELCSTGGTPESFGLSGFTITSR